MENLSVSMLNAFYGSLLTKKQNQMIELFYDFDLSLAEIAQQYDVSRQAVRDSIQRGEKSLQDFEAKLGLLEQNQKVKKQLQEIEMSIQNKEIDKVQNGVNRLKNLLEE